MPEKEPGETKQDRSTKGKDFSADCKYWESGAADNTQNHRLQRGRKALCPAPSYPTQPWHSPYWSLSPVIQSQAKDLALTDCSRSYLEDIGHLHGKRCCASVPHTESIGAGLQVIDLHQPEDRWVVMSTSSPSMNMSTNRRAEDEVDVGSAVWVFSSQEWRNMSHFLFSFHECCSYF